AQRTLCRQRELKRAKDCGKSRVSGTLSAAGGAAWRLGWASSVGEEVDIDYTFPRARWSLIRYGLHLHVHDVYNKDSASYPTDLGMLTPRLSAGLLAPLAARPGKLILSARIEVPALYLERTHPNPGATLKPRLAATIGGDLGVRLSDNFDLLIQGTRFYI